MGIKQRISSTLINRINSSKRFTHHLWQLLERASLYQKDLESVEPTREGSSNAYLCDCLRLIHTLMLITKLGVMWQYYRGPSSLPSLIFMMASISTTSQNCMEKEKHALKQILLRHRGLQSSSRAHSSLPQQRTGPSTSFIAMPQSLGCFAVRMTLVVSDRASHLSPR